MCDQEMKHLLSLMVQIESKLATAEESEGNDQDDLYQNEFRNHQPLRNGSSQALLTQEVSDEKIIITYY